MSLSIAKKAAIRKTLAEKYKKRRVLMFRAWDIARKCYLDVESICSDGSVMVYLPPCDDRMLLEPENVVIEQFTGLSDKNGKMIFEGDIIQFETYQGTVTEVVYFWNGSFGIDDEDDFWPLSDIGDNYADIQVVGDMHEEEA